MPSDTLITRETLEDLYAYWHEMHLPLQWNCLFLLPPWLKSWHSVFGKDITSEILVSRRHSDIIGIAPLLYTGKKALIIGNDDVCDYSHLIMNSDDNELFLNTLVDYLVAKNIEELRISGVTEDNRLYSLLPKIAASRGYTYTHQQHDVSYIKKLPLDWEEYFNQLTGKQRHEVRRKIKRLEEAGKIELRVINSLKDEDKAMDTFFQLFTAAGSGKVKFMDEQMNCFFRELMRSMSEAGLLRLFFLSIDDIPAATALCFEYNNIMSLYNSGYDPQFRSLSPGFYCKVMTIKTAIEHGCTAYDFLKGSEPYKRRLGGVATPVYTCHLNLR